MPTFDLAWNRTRLTWYRRSEAAPWQLQCILLERCLLEGRPQLRIVARLASILEDEIDRAPARDEFWRQARRKLGKLRRLSPCDISQGETLISARIAKPAPAYLPTARRSANPI